MYAAYNTSWHVTLLCKWVIWMGKKKKKYWCLVFFPSLIDFNWWFCLCTCYAMFNSRECICLPSVYHVFKMKTFKILSFGFLNIYIFIFWNIIIILFAPLFLSPILPRYSPTLALTQIRGLFWDDQHTAVICSHPTIQNSARVSGSCLTASWDSTFNVSPSFPLLYCPQLLISTIPLSFS